MTEPTREILHFDEFRFDPSNRVLTKNGVQARLRDRALDLLLVLIERAGHTVSHAELFARVWHKSVVEESHLRAHIAQLRRALGDDQSPRHFIASVPGGYMFLGEVKRIPSAESIALLPESPLADDSHDIAPLITPIGRDETIKEIAAQLRSKRFVTIIGPGGVGKTTVALSVAHQVAADFHDGVRFVDLAPLADAALVAPHVASVLNTSTGDVHRLGSVVASLRGRHMLIVLDNCEHVLDGLSATTEAICRGAPDVHILATSRESLRAAGEWVWHLEPLSVPPPVAEGVEALRFPAVQLLAQRVLESNVSYPITDADAPVMAEICRRLDGIPLAIELAAARVPLLGFRGLADRLHDRFGVLSKGRRSALARHQSLGALIDWSYVALRADEQVVWTRLAAFAGPFTLEAAEAVCTPCERDCSIITILDGLVFKSLVAVDSQPAEVRYRLLESLRLYALAKLTERGDLGQTQARHARYWYERSVGSYDERIYKPTRDWQRKHGAEIVDVRAALGWAFGPKKDRCDVACGRLRPVSPPVQCGPRRSSCERGANRLRSSNHARGGRVGRGPRPLIRHA